MNTLQYITNDDADDYFNTRLQNAKWLDATEQMKTAALIEGTRLIDRLNFAGNKVSTTQALQFPRSNTIYNLDGSIYYIDQDVTVPDDIKIACCEIAYALLDGVDTDKEMKLLSVTSQMIAGVRTDYDRSFVPEHFRAGIPSGKAWSYLRPYLLDPQQINLERI